ncbi:PEP-CTERM sorting domain-containing protein [Desulfobacter sp.]|uniref:PEP-CTERM sorting domain-containing protein n=1 Tax=Desulfobacter sp. TaxID=2294 RepID=UPI00257BDB90|nr:PEP-CTERM sorting domain-containing protein [Desulfobacter sp.]
MKTILYFIVGMVLTSAHAHATFNPSAFEFSNNEYTYQNGLGNTISGRSILIDGTQLEWLPLNFSTNYSYNEINSLIEDGNYFSDWRLASDGQINKMLKAYCNDIVFDLSDYSNDPNKNGAFNSFFPFFGDTYSPLVTTPRWWEYGFGYAIGFYNELTNDPYHQYASALIFSDAHYDLEPTYLYGDIMYISHGYGMSEKYNSIGSYLVRDVAPVPEPSTIALFSIGLLALAGVRRRKK